MLESVLKYTLEMDTSKTTMKLYPETSFVDLWRNSAYQPSDVELEELRGGKYDEIYAEYFCDRVDSHNRVNIMMSRNGWSDITGDMKDQSFFEMSHPRAAFIKKLFETEREYNWYGASRAEEKETIGTILNIWISPDRGVYCIVMRRTSDARNKIYLIFLYTGFVVYDKIKKIGSKISRDEAVVKFMRKALYHTGVSETILPSKGWAFISDKNGYPRAMTVLYRPVHLYKKCPKTWYAKNEDVINHWSKKIFSQNPCVVMRRNSNNGMVELGCFMPWPIEKLYYGREWDIYRSDILSIENGNEAAYKKNPDDFGVFVYQLSEKGKKMFDDFIAGGYNMSKWDELWKEYTGEEDTEKVIML